VITYDADAVMKAPRAHRPARNWPRTCAVAAPWSDSSNGDLTKGKGIDDHLAVAGPDRVLDEISPGRFSRVRAWRTDLFTRETAYEQHRRPHFCRCWQTPSPAFRHAPEWGGVLAFNEFAYGTVALKPTPWGIVPKGEWTDHEDRLAAEWLQKQGILVTVDVAGQAVQTAAREHPIHPVKTYLHGPQMGRSTTRGHPGFLRIFGAEDTEYARTVGSRWLISAVARILRPGR